LGQKMYQNQLNINKLSAQFSLEFQSGETFERKLHQGWK